MTDERRRPLAKRLARAVSQFSYQYDEKASSLGFLVQLWLPTETGVLTTKGSPFAISGCSETLALYKHESSKYTPTTDGANAACPVSRVFADLQPELPDSFDTGSWHYNHQKQMHFDRVAEAQRAGIHSTLLLPVYDSQTLANSGDASAQSSARHPVAVLELNQHEADVDFTEAVSLLNSICQEQDLCVPQLDGASSIQSWEGAVACLSSPADLSTTWNTASSNASWEMSSAAVSHPFVAPAAVAPAGDCSAATKAVAVAGAAHAEAHAQVLPGVGNTVRRYSCLMASIPAGLMQLFELQPGHQVEQLEQGFQRQVGFNEDPVSVQQQPRQRRNRRQSYIVTDYLHFYEQLGPSQHAAGDATTEEGSLHCVDSTSGSQHHHQHPGQHCDKQRDSRPSGDSQNLQNSLGGSANSAGDGIAAMQGTSAASCGSSGQDVSSASSMSLLSQYVIGAATSSSSQSSTADAIQSVSAAATCAWQCPPHAQQPPPPCRQHSPQVISSSASGSSASSSSSGCSSGQTLSFQNAGHLASMWESADGVQKIVSVRKPGAGFNACQLSSTEATAGSPPSSQDLPGHVPDAAACYHLASAQGTLGVQVSAAAGTGTAAAIDAPDPAWSAQQPQHRVGFSSYHTDVQAAGAGGGMLVDRVQSNHSSALLRTSNLEHSVPSILASTLSAEQAAKIQLGRLVGAGSFGRVFRGMLDGQEVAVKVLHHSKSSSKQISREVEMMMQLDHPNLVKAQHFIIWGNSGASQGLVGSGEWGSSSGVPPEQYVPLMTQSSLDGVCDADQNTQRSNSNESLEPQPSVTETWILSEFCNAGTLQESVHRRNDGPFFNNDVPQMYPILLVLLGVAQGIEWLHSQGILHSDLKASNVMLTVVPAVATAAAQDELTASRMAALTAAAAAVAQGSFSLELPSAGCELVAKVTDFGLSRLLRAGSSHLSTFTVGTLTHQAPEVMRSGRLSKPADAFSFGVLMWEVITATVPWYGLMMGEIMNAIMIQGRRLHYGPLVPKGYRELSQSCWADDPKDRPTFTSIVSQLQTMLEEAQDMQAEVQASSAEISGWWSD